MSTTTNIGLFKHDNPATNTDEFNVDKALNQNWDKIDEEFGEDRERISTLENDNTANKQDITEIKAKDTDQDKYIAELEAENTRLREDLNGLPKSTVSGESIDLSDSAEMRCEVKISGNSKLETRILPDEYTQVDYIESTSYIYNSNYINTGIFPTNNTSIEISVNIPSDTTHSYDRIFGSGTLFGIHLDGSNENKARVLWNKTLSSDYSLINVPFGAKNIIKQDKNATYLNGEKILEFSNGNFEDDKELRLFSSLEDSGDRDGILKLYYCKIWENNVLKRNFIPCYRNSDNEIGLYDTVNNVFYTNQGTGTFIKGNDSSLPSPDYPSEVESCGDNVNILIPDVNSTAISNYNDNIYTFKENLPIAWYKYIAKVNLKANKIYTISSDNYIGYGRLSLSTSITNGETIPDTSLSSYYAVRVLTPTRKNITFTSNVNQTVYLWYCTDTELSKKDKSFTVSIKLEEGSIATSYSSYGQGCINEVICNEKLYNKDTTPLQTGLWANNTVGFIQTNTSGWYIVLPINGGKKYIITKKNAGLIGVATTETEPKNGVTMIDKFDYANSTTTKEIQTSQGANYLYIGLFAGTLTEEQKASIIEELKVISEDYKEQVYTIPTQQPMRSVEITDTNIIRDTFIKKDNKKYERHYISRYYFTGNENLNKLNDTTIYSFKVNNIKGLLSNIGPYIKSNYFKAVLNKSEYTFGDLAQGLNDSNIYFVTNFLTVDDFKIWLAERYNAGTPVYVDYILKTPLDIECIEEQNKILDQIEKEVKTYKNVTHMYSTDKISSYKDVTYKKDLDTYIENKISPVINAVIELGGNINV